MDYIHKGSLEKYLSFITDLTPEMALELCQTLARGVQYLHMEIIGSKGKESVAHRDLSNTSVMVRFLKLNFLFIDCNNY